MIKPPSTPNFPAMPRLAGELAGTKYENHPEIFCQMLPKAETHLHGGSMVPLEVAWKIAQRKLQRSGEVLEHHGKIFKTAEEVRELYANPEKKSLPSYLDAYPLLTKHLFTNTDDIEEMAYEGAMHAARNGVAVLEIRTTIKSGALGDTKYQVKNLTPEEEFLALARGFERAKRESANHVQTFLTVCLRRDDADVERAKAIVSKAAALKTLLHEQTGTDYIQGLDVMGDEEGHKLKLFKPVYEHARTLGFKHFTAHCGEYFHEGSVNQAVFDLQVERVGHATALFLPFRMIPGRWRAFKKDHEKQTFATLVAKGVVVETCLTSNMRCGAEVTLGYRLGKDSYPDEGSKYRDRWRNTVALGLNVQGRPVFPVTVPIEHPRQYPLEINLALGGMVLLATDGIFTLDTNLSQEYMLAAEAFDLGVRELLCLSYHSILHSFAPEAVKRSAIESKWKPFAREFFAGNDPEAAMFLYLESWRKRLRHKHRISDDLVAEILGQRPPPP